MAMTCWQFVPSVRKAGMSNTIYYIFIIAYNEENIKDVTNLTHALQMVYGLDFIYNCTDGIEDHNKYFIVDFPDINPSLSSEFATTKGNKMINFEKTLGAE